MARNTNVEAAVDLAITKVDDFVAGATIRLPPAIARKACDKQLQHRSHSVRLGSLFFAYYCLRDPDWNCETVPTGTRGEYGDKKLSEALNRRSITLHGSITAFGENLGWKGNVADVNLLRDPRFEDFCSVLANANHPSRERIADYLASRFAESRRETTPLPRVGDDVLTFARASLLFKQLLSISSEGHIQQFLIAALLHVHRGRWGIEIRTHHPHASDRFDNTAGDVEELHNGELVRAYEVTVRPDWKNRLSGFRAKMDAAGIAKYVIIASGVNCDNELSEPANLITFLSPIGRDIAVIDISDVATVFAAELSATELREAVNIGYDYLCQEKLCGRADFQIKYRTVVDEWLDGIE